MISHLKGELSKWYICRIYVCFVSESPCDLQHLWSASASGGDSPHWGRHCCQCQLGTCGGGCSPQCNPPRSHGGHRSWHGCSPGTWDGVKDLKTFPTVISHTCAGKRYHFQSFLNKVPEEQDKLRTSLPYKSDIYSLRTRWVTHWDSWGIS